MDKAGSGLFERKPAAGLSREQNAGGHAQVGFVTDAQDDRVWRQGVEQRKQRAGGRRRIELSADLNVWFGAKQRLKNGGRVSCARQGT